jgi:hypothetical protein
MVTNLEQPDASDPAGADEIRIERRGMLVPEVDQRPQALACRI